MNTCRGLTRGRWIPGAKSFWACRHSSTLRPFQVNDSVVLRRTNSPTSHIFIDRLVAGKQHSTHHGLICHDDIIGNCSRDVIRSRVLTSTKRGAEYRLHEVRLEEYITSKKRIVTPLYPQDAQLIVNLFDLHPDTPPLDPAEEADHRVEILEAGTGHGSLTLFLSRAIHAANPPRPRPSPHQDAESYELAIKSWEQSRRAVIHSIETSARHSAHAEKVVRGFRRGMYAANVDFHVSDVGSWVSSALENRSHRPFLSHAFLDMPSAETQMETVSRALHTDGLLIMFNPSISQIIDAAQMVKKHRLGLALERVIELGVNGGCGGREWDVRAVIPRAQSRGRAAASTTTEQTPSIDPLVQSDASQDENLTAIEDARTKDDSSYTESSDDVVSSVSENETGTETIKRDERANMTNGERDWKWVCRPKVGEMVVGGGFLGVFRKLRDYSG